MMSNTGQSAYTAVFQKLKEEIPEWLPEEFLTDFNEHLMEALKNVYEISDEKIMGTFYSYSQVRHLLNFTI